MQRKNDRFLLAVAFTCTIILSFQPLIAVYRSPGKRLAAARQSSYTTIQKPVTPPVPTQEKKLEEKKDAQATQEVEKIEEEEEEEPAIENQDILPAPTGFLSKAYMLVTPLILVTLNAGVGIAIEAGTKSLIKSFSKRPLYLEEKAKRENIIMQIQSKHPEAIKGDELDLSLIPENKLKILIENTAELEVLDKSTSLSYIFSRAAYTFMIYTIFNTIAKITGYSASVTLDTLLQGVSPTQPKINAPKK